MVVIVKNSDDSTAPCELMCWKQGAEDFSWCIWET